MKKILSEEDINIIRKDPDKQNWHMICYHVLSDEFIREFQNYLDWWNVCRIQTLSEYFIIEFSNKIDWWIVSWTQKLSDKFIMENFEKLNINNLLENKNTSEETKDYIRMFT